MRSFLSIVISGVLAVAATSARAQMRVTLTIEDRFGAAVAGAQVEDGSGRRLGTSDAQGGAVFDCKTPCRFIVKASGFSAASEVIAEDMPANAAHTMTVQLDPAGATEQVTVTAYRAPMGELESPAITRQLAQAELQSTATVTMDDKLRQLPGVELFRRSSSLVANPSSQGISLRGLGSTSASRTLVTEDDVPLNDPVGGWIHWEEQPELALSQVELLRGGASDLYGSSAIGGVVSFHVAEPKTNALEVRSSYGGQNTYAQSMLAQGRRGPWGAEFAGTLVGTDGYIQEAPWQRGPVDVNSNVHARTGLALVEHAKGPLRLFARAGGFDEDRHNGTPYQINHTRLWRYALGGDWNGPRQGTLVVRGYGSTERYYQTFSSISNEPTAENPDCSYRCGEKPTKISNIPDNEIGASAHWTQPLGAGLLLLAGSDVHDVRVWDEEQTLATGSVVKVDVHQRDPALYGELMWVRNGWTVVGSARVDWFQNYDVEQLVQTGSGWTPAPKQPPSFSETVFDPRLGVTRKIGEHWAVSASGFRAFRAPTPSELYRSTQVGNQLTKANPSLQSERATGWEVGVATQREWGTVRTSWFDTQINRPISAVTVNPNSSPILLQRENLGQIESRGVSIDAELAPLRWLAVDGGYQYAHATVTKGPQDVGNWIPNVPHNMATVNLRASQPRLGTLSLQSRLSGRQYDNDANTFMLHGYFRMDAYGSHEFGRWLEVFAAGENLFDRNIEVAKTPTTTLARSRVARAGVNIRLGHERK
ncbi:TonB-dependent receptor [Occallatibacter riparius]|uniref:TonB-dependent receptor n=1 Tax=Occallatibacter riparius TaxID=1002689 RepID=A0A9J7BWC1_9BACT|nr:TonB-dependent receptor [Occallatibacter riparius]UWZ86106.1 TonB-dependent receptor [Occallatibacter riparius]